MKKKKINKKKIIVLLIIFVFTLLLIISGCHIVSYLIDNYKNKQIQKTIKEDYIKIVEPVNDEVDETYTVDFESLKKQNSNTVAYLKVNNTNIDYVVVRGKDNSYYLNHNFKNESNISGWIFSDFHNNFDGTDKNIVIFGHNTRDGSMFGTLKNVLTKNWQENIDNLKIMLITEKGTYYYQVFSTYDIKPEDYYINTRYKDNEEFNSFLNTVKSRSNYNYNVDVDYTDNILTLSSCAANGAKRVVLHAKLIKD